MAVAGHIAYDYTLENFGPKNLLASAIIWDASGLSPHAENVSFPVPAAFVLPDTSASGEFLSFDWAPTAPIGFSGTFVGTYVVHNDPARPDRFIRREVTAYVTPEPATCMLLLASGVPFAISAIRRHRK